MDFFVKIIKWRWLAFFKTLARKELKKIVCIVTDCNFPHLFFF